MATILVVDDEPTIRRLIRSTLEPQGHQILEAADGILGLKLAGLEQPDLVLLDIALPQLSGLEVNRRLQSNPETATIPVLYLTGLIPDALREVGSDEFLEQLSDYDDEMAARYEKAKRAGKKLRYIASLDAAGTASVELKQVSKDNPFSHIDLTDNLVQFASNRYSAIGSGSPYLRQ